VLNGTIDIKEHLLELDVGYPAFTAGQYRLLQEFHRSGKQIRQIEPYLEELLRIQYFLADDHDPEEIEPGTVAHSVYLAERDATGALIDYYKEVRGDNFLKILSTMNAFAKADAARFVLRDALWAAQMSSSRIHETSLRQYQLSKTVSCILRKAFSTNTTPPNRTGRKDRQKP